MSEEPYIAADLSLLADLPRGEHVFTEADRARVDELRTIIKATDRYEPPSPEEAHLYAQGVWDVNGSDGSIIDRRPFWYRKAETEEFMRLRFKEHMWRDA